MSEPAEHESPGSKLTLVRPSIPAFVDPLVLQLMNREEMPPRRYGLTELHRKVIAQLRTYSAHSIVETILSLLAEPAKDPLEELQRRPWHSLLVAKWALQDKRVNLTYAPRQLIYSREAHGRILQELWNFRAQENDPEQKPNAWQLFRSVFHAQQPFQREQDLGFLRWPALLRELAHDHPCRRMFRTATFLEPDDFSDLAMVMLIFTNSPGATIYPKNLAAVKEGYGERLTRFLELFSRDLKGLRSELRLPAALRLLGESELREFPYLQRFPLYRSEQGIYRCWHPKVFIRGIESTPHLIMMENAQPYVDAYSKVFERYVTELTTRACSQALVEADYKAAIKGSMAQEGKALEVIVPFVGCNVFVEAKMSTFLDPVLLEERENIRVDRLTRVLEAVEQGYSVSADIRRDTSPFAGKLSNAECDYLIVVVSRDLLVGGGVGLQRILPSRELSATDEGVQRRMPLHHIFIVDLADFENVMECVYQGWVDLPELLARAARNNEGGPDSRLTLFEHIRLSDGQQLRPALRHDESERVMERLRRTLKMPDA